MNDSNTRHSLKFERTLENDDYGLIISPTGHLKGIWVPDHLRDQPFPHGIVQMCLENYGVNPNHSDNSSHTVRQLH